MSVRRISRGTGAAIRNANQRWAAKEITAEQYRMICDELLAGDHEHERIYGPRRSISKLLVTLITGKGVMLGILAILLVLAAAPAHADPAADDRFLTMLENAGMVPEDREIAVSNGHIVCGNLWSGTETFDDQVSAILAVEQGMPEALARSFVAIAVQAYCPDISARRKVGE